MVSGDPDRTAATWLLANGSLAAVYVDGKPVSTPTVADLPTVTFEVRLINVNRNKKINDETLFCIDGLSHLKSAQITNCAATDKSLEYLKKSPQLRSLLLYATHVTDAGLPLLEGLSQLENLSLKQTDVTETGGKKLAAALPKCRIEWNGGVVGPMAETNGAK